MRLPYMIWAVIAGIIIAIQASTNTALRIQLNSPWISALINFMVGITALLIIICIAFPETFTGMKPILHGQVPGWKLLGGLMGAFFVLSITILIPHLGVGKTIVLYLCGQIIMSMVIDHFGWFSMPIDKLTTQKAIGVALLIAGVILTQKE